MSTRRDVSGSSRDSTGRVRAPSTTYLTRDASGAGRGQSFEHSAQLADPSFELWALSSTRNIEYSSRVELIRQIRLFLTFGVDFEF